MAGPFQQVPAPSTPHFRGRLLDGFVTSFEHLLDTIARVLDALGSPCGPRRVKKNSALICAMPRCLAGLQTYFFRALILTPGARVSMIVRLFWMCAFRHFFRYPLCIVLLVLETILETILHAFWKAREPWKSSQNVDGSMIFTLWTPFLQG